MMEDDLSYGFVRECFSYDLETGLCHWKVRPIHHFKPDSPVNIHGMWNARFAGKIAGAGNPGVNGYLRMTINYKSYSVHRLIWLWMTGSWPKDEIDHINHVKQDNSWCNLREASHQENCKNRPFSSANKSGFTGVVQLKGQRKWVAFIKVNGTEKNLGTFDLIEGAIGARKAANKKYGYHENHGKSITR